jgi:hypothetical protein
MASETGLGDITVHGETLLLGGGTIAALLAFFRWMLTLAGGRQDKRIAALEAEREQERNRTMALAQALMTLVAVVERSNPDEAALHAAKLVLKKAFPADAPEHPAH